MPKIAGRVTNSVDPDQTPRSAQDCLSEYFGYERYILQYRAIYENIDQSVRMCFPHALHTGPFRRLCHAYQRAYTARQSVNHLVLMPIMATRVRYFLKLPQNALLKTAKMYEQNLP